jgi:hypothetical protein
MPFKDEEFPQRLYDSLIRPTLREVTGLNCWKANDLQNQLQITDQIYSQILGADAVVAEISSENPNVLIEIGIALSHNKQVYVFYDSRILKDPPFYLGKIPHDSYADEDEFRTKLQRVRAYNP